MNYANQNINRNTIIYHRVQVICLFNNESSPLVIDPQYSYHDLLEIFNCRFFLLFSFIILLTLYQKPDFINPIQKTY